MGPRVSPGSGIQGDLWYCSQYFIMVISYRVGGLWVSGRVFLLLKNSSSKLESNLLPLWVSDTELQANGLTQYKAVFCVLMFASPVRRSNAPFLISSFSQGVFLLGSWPSAEHNYFLPPSCGPPTLLALHSAPNTISSWRWVSTSWFSAGTPVKLSQFWSQGSALIPLAMPPPTGAKAHHRTPIPHTKGAASKIKIVPTDHIRDCLALQLLPILSMWQGYGRQEQRRGIQPCCSVTGK